MPEKEKEISKEAKDDVHNVFWGGEETLTMLGNLDGRIQKLLDAEKFPSPDLRVQIMLYNVGELAKWRVYDCVYLDKNPVKTSLKSFGADALIQLLIYMKSLGLNIEECLQMGFDRMNERVYEHKIAKSKKRSK